MKKIYFLIIAFCFFAIGNAQNPTDRDPSFNQYNLPINHYFVDADVTKSAVLPDGKILIIKSQKKLIRLDNNLLDTSFNTGTGFVNLGLEYLINDFAIQPDGKIIVSGLFTSYNGNNVKDIVRLNPNGSLDLTFNCLGINLAGFDQQIGLQSDGKILILGVTNGNSTNLRRLNSNGSIDTSFTPSTNYFFGHFDIQTDGKIIVFYSTNSNNYVSRLNTNGSIDTSFTTVTPTNGFNQPYINKIKVLTNGKIMIGGTFNLLGIKNLIQLNQDGTSNLSFNTSGTRFSLETFQTSVNDIVEQNDGKVIVGGYFVKFNGIERNNLLRLNLDGSLDNTLINPNNFLGITYIKSLSLFNDEKVLISGDSGRKKSDSFIVKINTDGTKDITFNNIRYGFFNTEINAITETSDGKILVGGNFNTYNDFVSPNFAKLNSDGSFDTTLTSGALNGFEDGKVTAITSLSNGQILIGGDFTKYNGQPVGRIIKINSDGTIDPSFNTQFPLVNNNRIINTICQLEDGRILVGLSVGYNCTDYDCGALVYLNSNGFILYSIHASNFSKINLIRKQTDGKILIGGSASLGIFYRRTSTMSNDPTFILDPTITNYTVNNVAIQQDGKIIMQGDFVINGVSKKLIRIFSDGTLDPSFNYLLDNDIINNFGILPSQKFIISVRDSNYISRIIRLNNDGSIDNTFTEQIIEEDTIYYGSNITKGVASYVYPQSNGKIILYGMLNYQGNTIGGITRLMGNSTLSSDTYDIEDNISLWPNPTKDFLNIDVKEEIELKSINIYNTLGQLVLVIPNTQITKTVNVSSLTSGNYFIKINSNKGSSTSQFIKK